MKRGALTLITVTKDDPAGLARTISSAGRWRALGVEHLVVDGSTTPVGTAEDDLSALGVRTLRRTPRGVADAFNVGWEAATTEWIWFLNGGDEIDPRLDPVFLAGLIDASRGDIIIGALTYAGQARETPHPPPKDWWPAVASWIPHPASIVRRQLFERWGGFDPRYRIAMDHDWWLRVLGQDIRVDVINVPLAVFAPGGISQQPALRAQLAQERDDIIRRHQYALGRSVLRSALRFIRSWVRAVFGRRIHDRP